MRRTACIGLLFLVLPWGTAAALRGGEDLSAAKRDLSSAISAGDFGRLREVILTLGGTGEAEAVNLIFRALLAVAPEEVVDAAITALTRLGPELTAGPFEEQLGRSKPDPVITSIIFVIAEQQRDERSEGWLLTGLTSKDELIVRNAIEGLRQRRSKMAIPELIRILESTSGKRTIITYAAHQALIDLTGHDFEVVADWWAFWEMNKDSIDIGQVEKNEGETGIVRRKPDDKVPTFFGVEIVSRRLVFVIDCSGSMEMFDEAQEEEGGSGADWRVRQRMLRARNQLIAAIERLPSNASFNVVAYNDDVKVLNPKGIVPATGQWKKKAVDFTRSLKAQTTTHTDKALRTAFEDKNIDSIILLSDGAPNHGRDRPGGQLIPEIMEEVRKLNRLRKLKIFTFGFEGLGRYPPGHKQESQPPAPSDGMVDFLKRLAGENGGSYTRIL